MLLQSSLTILRMPFLCNITIFPCSRFHPDLRLRIRWHLKVLLLRQMANGLLCLRHRFSIPTFHSPDMDGRILLNVEGILVLSSAARRMPSPLLSHEFARSLWGILPVRSCHNIHPTFRLEPRRSMYIMFVGLCALTPATPRLVGRTIADIICRVVTRG